VARRVSLPAADDLFRPTSPEGGQAEPQRAVRAVSDTPDQSEPDAAQAAGARKPSGRVRHDEKMTVYVTSDELLDIEHTRLVLRRTHGLAVDRGRVVREALALVLADFEAHGADSALVRRLTEE
jgi:hypothetical protein